MVCKLSHLRRASLLLVLSLGLVSSGCLFSPDEGGGGPPPEIRLDRTTREKTLDFYETVWKNKLYERYEEVLHDEYEFFPLDEDADDFPWMEGSSWPRTAELGMAFNMFDAGFSGGSNPVDLIELELSLQSERLLDEVEQRYELTCTQVGRVMWNATDGRSFDTRVTIELVPDPDEPGLWQIIRQDEIPRI